MTANGTTSRFIREVWPDYLSWRGPTPDTGDSPRFFLVKDIPGITFLDAEVDSRTVWMKSVVGISC